MKELVEKFEIHDELNPKLWTKDMTLKPDVRQKILEIVDEFKELIKGMLDIEINPLDIYLLGSNASYNYTDQSDLDVHIVLNFDMIDDNKGLVQTLMNFSKADFNSSYDISVYDIDVELYVEDINSSTLSNGIYSVMTDQWIKEPQPITDVPEIDIEDDVDDWKTKINEALNSNDPVLINQMVDNLYILRKNGLLSQGEYGKDNQIFKEIRSLGLLKDLKDEYLKLKSKELSLENLQKKENSRMKYAKESKSDSVKYFYLDDVEAGMIDNMDDKDVDYWVKSDDIICKLLNSSLSEVVTCPKDELPMINLSYWTLVKEKKIYGIELYTDNKGNKIATDNNNDFYFADIDSLDKVLDDYSSDYEFEALNTKTTDEVSVYKKGEWELIKDSSFGNDDEYLILKNDEAVRSFTADNDEEAKKKLFKFIQRGW